MCKPVYRTWALMSVHLLAFWQVWEWFGRRLLDHSDEPWGVLGLGIAGWLFIRSEKVENEGPMRLGLPATMTVVCAVAYPFSPPMLRAALALTAIGLAVSRLWHRKLTTGVWALLMMSLPVIPTVQFYGGYPLRWLTAAMAAMLLQLGGFGVVQEGAALAWNGYLVSVDTPCSGVRMLWTGLVVGFSLAAGMQFGVVRTICVGLTAGGLVIVGNVMRSSALFYTEVGLLVLPAWSHAGVGMVVFAALVSVLAWLTPKFAPAPKRIEVTS